MEKGKKKTSFWVKLLAILGGYTAANVGMMNLLCYKNGKKMAENNNQYNMMNSVFLGNQTVEVKEDTDNVYLTCLTGKVTVDMTKLSKDKPVLLDLFAFAGNITVLLPEGVKINLEGEGLFDYINYPAPTDEQEGLPVVTIKRMNFFSSLTVKVGEE